MATFEGKDGYKIKIEKSGPGYGWEAFDPEGKQCCKGLQANSEQHAKEQADQKLGMKIFNSTAFQTGADRATKTINQKAEAAGVRIGNAIRSMSKTEILKRAREGRLELMQDIDNKRNGDHVEVRVNGKSQHIQIEGD